MIATRLRSLALPLALGLALSLGLAPLGAGVGPFGAGLAAAQTAEEEAPRGEPLDRFLEREFSDEARQALQDLFAAVGPLVQRFADMMEDVPRYEAPEILPNGDIIIRRKRGGGDGAEGEVKPGEEIET